jgi:hypothetical protein
MNALRWAAVLPFAFVCGVIAAIVALAVSHGITCVKVITGLVAGAVFVAAGAIMAPSHKLECVLVLAVINSIYSLSQARSLTLAPGQKIDWLSISRALGGFLPVCNL